MENIKINEIVKLQIGDVVKLKSGGPVMTYIEDDNHSQLLSTSIQYLKCQWFDQNDKIHQASFPMEVLEKFVINEHETDEELVGVVEEPKLEYNKEDLNLLIKKSIINQKRYIDAENFILEIANEILNNFSRIRIVNKCNRFLLKHMKNIDEDWSSEDEKFEEEA